MYFFKSNDRFKVKDSELTGTVIGVWYNYSKNDYELTVKWDHSMSSTYSYLESDVRDMWEKIEDLPHGKSAEHFHEWVNYVGFNELYQFCKICDEKRK